MSQVPWPLSASPPLPLACPQHFSQRELPEDHQRAPPCGRPHGFPCVAPSPRRPSWLPLLFLTNVLSSSFQESAQNSSALWRLSLFFLDMAVYFFIHQSAQALWYETVSVFQNVRAWLLSIFFIATSPVPRVLSGCSISIDWRISLDWYLLCISMYRPWPPLRLPIFLTSLDSTDNLLLYKFVFMPVTD